MKILQKFRKVLQSKKPLLMISQFLNQNFLETTKGVVSKPRIHKMWLIQHSRFKVTTLLMAICLSPTFSQTTAQLSKIVPPSPTAASLGRYGDIPVSYYSGNANLNIPLHTIKTQNHELDISLSYSTSGLKPSEEASWAGLGWALNAGGVITRTVRGGDDLRPFAGYWSWGQCLPAANANNDYDNISTAPNQQQLDLLKFIDMSNGIQDGEPDIFNYNAGPHVGKFVLDKHPSNCSASTGGVLMAQRNNLDITYDNSGGYATSKWVITDGNGYKYTFGQQETTVNSSHTTDMDMNATPQYVYDDYDNLIETYYVVRPNSYPPTRQTIWLATIQNPVNNWDIITSWYLTSIVSPQGETITFIYKTNPYNSSSNYPFSNAMAGSVASTLSTSEEHYKQIVQNNTCMGTIGQSAIKQYSFQNHFTVYLEKITFNGGSVVFNNTTAMANPSEDLYRDDLLYNSNFPDFRPRRLRNIEVRDDKDALVKRFVFTYDYFNKNLTLPSGATTADYSRLRLDNVVEYGSDGITSKRPYQFTYNDLSGGLPRKTTLGLDGWGYFNGYDNNVTLLHNIEYTTSNPKMYYLGGLRTPASDVNYLLGGTLKEVLYPTGGKTSFNYELNTYVANNGTTATGGGLRIKSLVNDDALNTPLVKSYRYTNNGTPTGSTSGLLLSTPYFLGEMRHNFIGNYPHISHCIDDVCHPIISHTPTCSGTAIYLYRSSSSLSVPGFSAYGANVGYSKVTEMIGPNGEGGSTEYNYRNTKDIMSSMPGTPNLSASDNGLLNSVVYKDNLGNTKRLVVNEYNEKESRSIKGLYVKTDRSFHPSFGSSSIMYKFYDNPSKWYALTSRTETDFINGSTQVVKTTTYDYANTSHKEVTSEAVTQSDGSILTTKYKRIQDYNTSIFTANSVYDAMKTRHMISPVIEQQTYVQRGSNSRILSGSITDYKLVSGNATSLGPIVASLGTTPTIVAPSTAHEFHVLQPQACTTTTCAEFESSISGSTLSRNGNYELMETYTAYDEKGNLVQMSNTQGELFSYKMSYNKTELVSLIKNAGHDEVAYFGFEGAEEFTSLGSNITLSNQNAIAKTGYSSLSLNPNQFITTTILPKKPKYQYSFWVRTSAAATLQFLGGSANTLNISCPNTSGGWQLIQGSLSLDILNANYNFLLKNTSSAVVQVDDFRFHPEDAMVSTYTHKVLVGPSSVSDENNQPVNTYDYDALGRLLSIRDRDGNIEKQYSYKYSGQFTVTLTDIEGATGASISPSAAKHHINSGGETSWNVTGAAINKIKVNGVLQTLPYTAADGTSWTKTSTTLKVQNIKSDQTFTIVNQ